MQEPIQEQPQKPPQQENAQPKRGASKVVGVLNQAWNAYKEWVESRLDANLTTEERQARARILEEKKNRAEKERVAEARKRLHDTLVGSRRNREGSRFNTRGRIVANQAPKQA